MLRDANKMNLSEIVNITKIIYNIFGIVYVTSGIIINFIQLLLFIFVKPYSEYLFRKCNYYLSYSLYSQIVFLLQYWANVQVTLHSKKNDYKNHFGKESAFLIMNHSYEIDWMIGWILCDGCRILGNVKTFAKKSLKYLPTLGYSWLLGGSIFVERNWKKDEKMFEKKIRELASYTDPIWLLLAAEGTRFTREKHEVSKAFAKENGLPELRHHLTPRTKGFTGSLPILKKSMAAVYNVNVVIKPDGVKPTLTNILHGKSINADFYVERTPMKDLPDSEADLAAWLHSLYKRKNRSKVDDPTSKEETIVIILKNIMSRAADWEFRGRGLPALTINKHSPFPTFVNMFQILSEILIERLGQIQKKLDDLVHSYLTTGNWNLTSSPQQYESFLLPRRIFPLINFSCWLVCVVFPLGSFLIKLILNGSLLSLGTAAAIIGSFVFFLDKLIGETQISKASSYGIKKISTHTDDIKNKN